MQFTRETDRAFDLWLVRSLSAQYAPALLEDMPRELLALLAEPQARAGRRAGGTALPRRTSPGAEPL